ncbi:hypothetical protein SCARD494_09711 [Seiridium cardinale]
MQANQDGPIEAQATAPRHGDHQGTESGPTKVNTRISDGAQLYSDRGVQLEHGPLVRNVGEQLVDDEVEDAHQFDAEHGNNVLNNSLLISAHGPTQPQGGLILPYGPLANSYSEQSALSDSSHGMSFSVNTAHTSSMLPPPARSLDALLFTGMQCITIAQPEPRPGDILENNAAESDLCLAKTEDEGVPLFPWRHHFSWETEGLAFAGEPLFAHGYDHRVEEGHSSSNKETGLMTSSEYDPRWPCLCGLEIHDVNSTLVEDGNISRASQAHLAAEALQKFCERFIELLHDDYWRSRGPQRSNDKHHQASLNGYDTQPYKNPHNSDGSKATGSLQHHRRARGTGSSNGESNDGSDSFGDKTDRRSKRDNRRVDCPFYRRYPSANSQCTKKGFANVTKLKRHLKTLHPPESCLRCGQSIHVEQDRLHSCLLPELPIKERVTLFMTEGSLIQLNKPAKRKSEKRSLRHQWIEIFKILFPQAKSPWPSPYMDCRLAEMEKLLKHRFEERLSHLSHLVAEISPPMYLACRHQLDKVVHDAGRIWVGQVISELWPMQQPSSMNGESSSRNESYESEDSTPGSGRSVVCETAGMDQTAACLPFQMQQIPDMTSTRFPQLGSNGKSPGYTLDFNLDNSTDNYPNDWSWAFQAQSLPRHPQLVLPSDEQDMNRPGKDFADTTSDAMTSVPQFALNAVFNQFDKSWHGSGQCEDTEHPSYPTQFRPHPSDQNTDRQLAEHSIPEDGGQSNMWGSQAVLPWEDHVANL